MSEAIKKYLAEVKARHEATTEGEWKDDPTDDGWLIVKQLDLQGFDRNQNIYMGDMETTDKYDHADAAFIAHAHQDVPALLAMLDKALTALEDYEATHLIFRQRDTIAGFALKEVEALIPPTEAKE